MEMIFDKTFKGDFDRVAVIEEVRSKLSSMIFTHLINLERSCIILTFCMHVPTGCCEKTGILHQTYHIYSPFDERMMYSGLVTQLDSEALSEVLREDEVQITFVAEVVR